MSQKIGLLALIAVVVCGLLLSFEQHAPTPYSSPVLSEKSVTHILYGNERGGGHLYGANKPCKSEFPKDWSADDVIARVTQQAANDNLPWRQEDNGYYVSEKNHGEVRVRVVMNQDRSHIVTAYPTNRPRNPCQNE